MSDQFWFNSGLLTLVDAAAAIPTPVEIGTLTDISIDFSGARKDFNGPYQYPVSAARGDASIVCKAKFGGIKSKIYSDLFFGTTPVTGLIGNSIRESHAIPSGHIITPTQIKTGQTFDTNLGALLVATDGSVATMTRVSTVPTTGQYSLDETSGIYTFAVADIGKLVLITYLYLVTAGPGVIVPIENKLMGDVPKFRAILTGKFEGKAALMDLYNCISDKLNLATKKGDYANPEMDFAAISNPAGIIGRLSFAE